MELLPLLISTTALILYVGQVRTDQHRRDGPPTGQVDRYMRDGPPTGQDLSDQYRQDQPPTGQVDRYRRDGPATGQDLSDQYRRYGPPSGENDRYKREMRNGPLTGQVDRYRREPSHEDLQREVDGLIEEVRVLSETVVIQNKILHEHEVELDSVSQVGNQSLELLKELTGTGPGDCSELYLAGMKESGVQLIYPRYSPPVKVYCDMHHDGGGWTVIQRRFDGRLRFDRTWVDYARGFGNPGNEHWLGLRTVHRLTTAHHMELYVALTDFNLGMRSERYGTFSVGSEDEKFRLRVGQPSGDAGDSLSFHNGLPFSTKDRDNDAHGSSCSRLLGGSAWWFKACHISNLNGVYYRSMTSSADAMSWYGIRNSHTSLKASLMLMRPADFKSKLKAGQN